MRDKDKTNTQLRNELVAMKQRIVELEAAEVEHKQTEEILRNVAQGVSAATGEEFFQSLVRYLAQTLEADYAFIGELTGETGQNVTTVAVSVHSEITENFSYQLKDTPCENVVGQSLCIYSQRVQQLFPLDHLLVEMNVESYIGTPLFDSTGRTLGLIVVLDSRPLNGKVELAKSMLQIFATRAAAELERKRTEEKFLRRNQKLTLFNQAIEQTVEGVIITDSESIILYVNPAFERITGYSRAELLGQTPRIFKNGEQDSAIYQEKWATISAGEVWHGRLVNNNKKDGTLYTVDITITPVRDESGVIINYVGLQRDVTQELQLEEQYRQAQKMEAIGRLTGGVAHDFNNLLTSMMGYAGLILQTLPPDDPARRDIEGIQKTAERAANLTHQLLAFSRKQPLQPAVLSLNTLVTDVKKMLRRLISEDIELVTILEPTGGKVKADQGQLGQVIMNLVINARDAMPRGGKLTIETTTVEVDEAYADRHLSIQPGPYVMLAVSDTGTGMDEETRTQIFEPFFTTKREGKGTGLGLSTVYGIVKQSGGDIWVYSEPGWGTTFKIYLPCVEASTAPLSPQVGDRADVPVGSETILLVEDNAGVRDLARRILQEQGYTVLEAQDGQAALQAAADHNSPIHLLLSDVVMPGLSGQAVTEQLSQIEPNLKILFMSGYTDDTIAHHGVSSNNGVAFLQKPFSFTTLARKVREVLDAA